MSSNRLRLVPLLGALALLAAGCDLISESLLGMPAYRTEVDRVERVMVPMRDGVRLATDVYYPEATGPVPAILIRNPYNMWNVFGPVSRALARYGYVVVHQDVRGRFDSEGAWLPLLNEREDGIDTIRWLAAQPFHDGNIALFGASYLSAVQWAIADALPPEVKTIVPMIIGTDLRRAVYEDGMFRHEVFTFWAALMPDEGMGLMNAVAYRKARRHMPAIEADERFLDKRLDWYRQWLESPHASADLWQMEDARRLRSMPTRVSVPTLMITGWYDIFLGPQLEDFRRLATRDRSRILVGPWTHLLGLMGDGVKDFPGAGGLTDHMGKVVNWLDHHLKDAPLEEWGPVQTYAVNAGWRERPAWPPLTKRVRFHLAGPRHARACDGGRLLSRPATDAGSVSYRYDPERPTPTRGGGPLLAFVMPGWSDARPSNRYQQGLCRRDDVLTFVTPEFTRDMHVSGPLDVVLTVSSTARDTAFTAKLMEVPPGGRAVNIRDGITRLAFRNGATEPVAYEPGRPVTAHIDLWPIEWRVEAGSRLRLDVSSSNFPAYAVHANRPGPWAHWRDPVVARQTLHMGGEHAAYLDVHVAADE